MSSRARVVAAPQQNQFAKVQGVDNVIVRLQTSLDQVEKRQIAALSSVEDRMESRVRRMRGVFTDLGLDLPQLEAAAPRRAASAVPSFRSSCRPMPARSSASSTGSTSPAPRSSA